MRLISNEVLIDSYFKAIELKLDQDFIDLLLEEINRRGLKPDYFDGTAQVS
jgi:developmental checkpoint coupling sporulation initiation to replication initiation